MQRQAAFISGKTEHCQHTCNPVLTYVLRRSVIALGEKSAKCGRYFIVRAPFWPHLTSWDRVSLIFPVPTRSTWNQHSQPSKKSKISARMLIAKPIAHSRFMNATSNNPVVCGLSLGIQMSIEIFECLLRPLCILVYSLPLVDLIVMTTYVAFGKRLQLLQETDAELPITAVVHLWLRYVLIIVFFRSLVHELENSLLSNSRFFYHHFIYLFASKIKCVVWRTTWLR